MQTKIFSFVILVGLFTLSTPSFASKATKYATTAARLDTVMIQIANAKYKLTVFVNASSIAEAHDLIETASKGLGTGVGGAQQYFTDGDLNKAIKKLNKAADEIEIGVDSNGLLNADEIAAIVAILDKGRDLAYLGSPPSGGVNKLYSKSHTFTPSTELGETPKFGGTTENKIHNMPVNVSFKDITFTPVGSAFQLSDLQFVFTDNTAKNIAIPLTQVGVGAEYIINFESLFQAKKLKYIKITGHSFSLTPKSSLKIRGSHVGGI